LSLRARALDEFDALLDEPRAVQEARLVELAAEDAELAEQVRRLLQADRSDTTLTDAGLGQLVGRAALDLDLPERLGPYRIVGEIGRGGMGVVYEAEQVRPRRRVALKTLPVLGVTPEARSRFEVEVQALAQVQHPGIPQVYEFFEHDGRPIVAMELVQGQPLDQALATADPIRRARVLERVAEAIAHVHDRGVVHRDLKPSNILVGPDDQPKVLDFGIAELGEGMTGTAGTPRYMAPEQRAGRPHDARVDVYALGVMARELLADASLRPRDLATLLGRATAQDPADRTPSAAALAQDLRRWRRLQPLLGVPTPLHRRLGLLVRRAPLAMLLGVVSVVLALTGLGGLGWSTVSAWDARRLQVLQERAAEQAAADRLSAVQQWADEAGPDAPALAQTFTRLVEDPALAETAALSDAWTWWADQVTDVRERPIARSLAWVHATTPEQERRTRVALALAAWERGDWAALEGLTRDLEPDLPPQVVQAAAFWRGDRQGVTAALSDDARPLARLLDEVRWEARSWDRREVVGSHWIRAERGRLHITDARGVATEQLDIPEGRLRLWEEDGALVVWVSGRAARFTPGTGQTELSFTPRSNNIPVAHGTLRDGTPFQARTPSTGLVIHVDGRPEPLVLSRDQVGYGHLGEPATLDVNGDGSDEVVLATSGWRDAGLQVWDLHAQPPRLLSHRAHVAYRVRRLTEDPPRVVVSEAPPDTTPTPFLPHLAPPERMVRVLRWQDGGWVPESELVRRDRMSGLLLADLDGDGVDDLVAISQGLTFLLRGLGDGRFSEPLVLPDVYNAIVVQADDDPAQELWLRGMSVPGVVLGMAGTEPLTPPPAQAPAQAEPAPPGASPSVRRRWQRLAELVRLGLTPEAVRGLEPLGRQPAPVGPAALRWALELSDDRPGDQRRLALALRRHAGATDADIDRVDRTLRQAVHHVEDAAERVWHGPEWPLHVLRDDAVRARLDGSLELLIDASSPDLLRLPVQPTDGPVRLSLRVQPTTLDFGSGLRLQVHNGERAADLQLQRVGGGAAEEHRLALRCGQEGALDQHLPALPTEPIRVELSWDAAQGSLLCRSGDTWMRMPVDLGPPAQVWFTLGTRPSRFDSLTRMGLHLTQVRLSGATPATDATFDAGRQARLARAERLSQHPDPTRAALGWGRRGQPESADLSALAVLDLARLLREDHDLWLPTVRAQRPRHWARALWLALEGPHRVQDDTVFHVLDTALLRNLDPSDADQRQLLVVGAEHRWRAGDGVGALRLLSQVPDHIEDPGLWHLRARLHAQAGDARATRHAIARWRASARPAFRLEPTLRTDPYLTEYAQQELADP